MKIATEKRALRLAPGVVMQMISGQAGSLAKAVTEAVMNSVDAFATRVDIHLRPDFVSIEDDGKGFQSRQEIEAWFEVLGGSAGLKGHRLFGEFGLGRAQLWKYCPTVWHSGEFRMEVDVPKRGFDYELASVAKRVGTLIEGPLFKELAPLDLQDAIRELKHLCALVATPVFLNGERISTPPKELEWTHDSELAHAELHRAKRGEVLAVYNQGVFVCTLQPSGYAGMAGKVCTKEGQALQLNISRNQIMSDCLVWNAIVAEWLTGKSRERSELSPAADAKEGAKEIAELARNTLQAAEHHSYYAHQPQLKAQKEDLLDTTMARDVLGNTYTLRQVLSCELPQLFSQLPAGGSDAARELQLQGKAIVYTNETVSALSTAWGTTTRSTLQAVLDQGPGKKFVEEHGFKPDFRFGALGDEFPETREVIKPIEAPNAALKAAADSFAKALVALGPELPEELRPAWAGLELQPARMLSPARADGQVIQVSDKVLLSAFSDVAGHMPALTADVLKAWLGDVCGLARERVQELLLKIRLTDRFFSLPALALLLRSESSEPGLPPLTERPLQYLRAYIAA